MIDESYAKGTDVEPKFDATSDGIVGIVLYSWFYRATGDTINDSHTAEWTTSLRTGKNRKACVFGFVEYRVELILPFENDIYPLTAMQHDPSQASVLGVLLADARFWRPYVA